MVNINTQYSYGEDSQNDEDFIIGNESVLNTQSNEFLNSNKKIQKNSIKGMSDGNASMVTRNSKITSEQILDNEYSGFFTPIFHANNLFARNELNLYDNTYRFGVMNPYGAVTKLREYLFFTKPDLHIFQTDDANAYTNINKLNEGLADYPFWVEFAKYKKRIGKLLQLNVDDTDNFNHLLQNSVVSNLPVPSLESTTIETPNNMYGVGFSYRGSSEASDDSHDFSLEFKDTRWLDVYYFFKAYEEYETLKHHGIVSPVKYFTENKILHDQFSIYKFLVDDDAETLVYWAKYYGVMPLSLPRDVFSDENFDNGITYSVNFKAAFFEDMRPEIISDFNDISEAYYNSLPYRIDVYNEIYGRADNRPAKAAYIHRVESKNSPNGYVYKLKWKGSDEI